MAARLEKLRTLLKRVEERRGKPRLHAVSAPPLAAAPVAAPPVAAAPVAPAPVAPAARPLSADDFFPSLPPAAAPRPAAKSPLEDAIGDFGAGAPLEVTALAEPINAPRPEPRPTAPPAKLPEPVAPPRPVAAAPSRAPAPPLAPVVPIQPAPVPSARVTLEFERPVADPRVPAPVPAPAPPSDLSAPTQTIAPAPLASSAAPVRAVSELRVEAPKSFGELLELSLALRPR